MAIHPYLTVDLEGGPLTPQGRSEERGDTRSKSYGNAKKFVSHVAHKPLRRAEPKLAISENILTLPSFQDCRLIQKPITQAIVAQIFPQLVKSEVTAN